MTSQDSAGPAKKIVVAVDGSAASDVAVRWAANAAVKRQQPLALVNSYTMPQFMYADGIVPPEELYTELENESKEKISAARAIVADHYAVQALDGGIDALEIEEIVKESAPIDFLLELSETAEMIVMGSRGLGGLSGLVMGSVSAAVVSHAQCPVVVVRKDSDVSAETKYGPVVVGVDGSEVSDAALAQAFREADARGAELRAIHSWTDSYVQSSYLGMAESADQFEAFVQERQSLLTEAIKPYLEQYPKVAVEEIVVRERPVAALADHAEDAQLLVVGSHGRGGFSGMLLGSTSRALLHAAPCPLMVVRQGS